MYLSRLWLDPRNRAVQQDLADCHALHRRVMEAFPQGVGREARQQLGVLHRADVDRATGQVTLLVQSREQPDWTRLAAGYLLRAAQTKPVDRTYSTLGAGMRCRFRLHANPTRRIHPKNAGQGEKWRGKRVDLRDAQSRADWLARKAAQSGFRLVEVVPQPDAAAASVTAQVRSVGFDPVGGGARRMTFGGVVFEGYLEIVDPLRFRIALEEGIGSGKAFGFGLLSIAPAG
jgi:CRISPR system Cascade subunit CasE